jgi:hypothetical protein
MALSICIMNKSIVLKEQLFSLREDQKSVISDYYHLVSNSFSSPPDVDEVIRVWKIAEADPRIATWLEFIDFFFIPSPDDAPILSEDSRSYLSEHILLIALQKHPQDSEMNGILDTLSSLLTLKCPDGTGSFTLPSKVMTSKCWNVFMQEQCPQCDRPLSEHDISFVSHDKDIG